MQAIVLVLRGCPAGWLGAYGNEWVATPNLDRFAAGALIFDQHISDCPTTEAAHAAWRTGQSQVPPMEDAELPRPTWDVIAELGRAGVRTVLVHANHPDTDVRGFEEIWSEVVEARPQAEDGSPLDELTRQFPTLLERLGRESPWLLWIEIDRLLPPWDIPQDVFEAYLDDSDEDETPPTTSDAEESEEEDDDEDEPVAVEPIEPVTPWSDPPVGPFDTSDLDAWEWLHSSFAAVVTTLDAELGRLLERLKDSGHADSTAVLLTSDFGWPLGEHGAIGPHRPRLHEELIHLPLLLRLPGALPRHVPTFTQPADLAPTLAELLGVKVGEGISGKSLLPLARGEVQEVRPYAISGLCMEGEAEWALRTPEWAFLLPHATEEEETGRTPALYVKPDDRWEVHDVRSLHLDWVEQATQLLREVTKVAPTGS